MQRIDNLHHTPEQIEGYITAALALVAKLEPPEDLRPAVFAQAAQMLSSKSISILQEQPMQIPHLAIPRQGRH